ncbi:lipopolysaccharide biosynthesis protein [Fretibacter rubidus]|uniref:lipopolysaccharide biosynthesis protein n=1 Tax=Fretibacter rubidus TaxID=570162 RepID=UPI00352AF58D
MTKSATKPDLSTASSASAGKRVAANSGMMVGAKTLAAVMGFVTLTITAVALDSTLAFGTIMFLHAYMLFFSEVATFQAWQGIIRFGSDDVVKDDAQSLAKLFKFGITLDFLSAIAAYVMAIALFSFFIFVGSQFPSLSRESALSADELQHYVMLYCIVILFRQLGTSIGVFRLFDKFQVLAVKALIMPTTRLLGAIYAAHAGWGLEGFLCVWFGASLVSYIFLPVAAMLELKRRRLLGMVIRAKSDFFSPRAGLWPFTIKSNIDSTLAAGHLHLPLLLVTAIFGPAFAGIYKIAEEAAKLLSEGFKLFDQVIYPEIAKMISSGDGTKIWQLVTRTAFVLLSFGLFFSALLMFLGPNALSALFGEDYAAAAPLASLLVPAAALLGIVAPLYPIYYATDCPEKAIYARSLSLFIFIVALFALSPTTVGQMAPGWAAIIGNIFAVVFVAITAKRALNASLNCKKDML